MLLRSMLLRSMPLRSDEEKLVLLLLAMKIDGIKDEELSLFNEVAKDYGIDEIKDIKAKVKELLSLDEPINEVFEEYAKEVIQVDKYYAQDNAKFLWTLINMGFIDKDYSDNERKLVDSYCEIAKIDKAIARQMEDIAHTISVVLDQKDFVDNSTLKVSKAKIMCEELDKSETILKKQISELITLSATL